jgi:SlyX protein
MKGDKKGCWAKFTLLQPQCRACALQSAPCAGLSASRMQGIPMEDRLTELEIKLNLTEDMVEELNRTIYRQQQQIDLLQHQLRHLFQQMQPDAEPAEPRNLRDEIPPHY